MLGLTAVSVALAGKGRVTVKDGYAESLRMWTGSVLPPGARKSTVFKHMMRPIAEYEADEETRYRSEIDEIEDERDVIERALDKAKKQACNALAGGIEDQHEEASNQVTALKERLDQLQAKVRRADVITVSDITPERLGQRMKENFGRAAIVSPEGDIFNIMAGLYNEGRLNLQAFKKGWTGDEAITDDRLSREGTRVARPALVVGVTIQPVVLAMLAKKEQFRGEGLLGHFLYVQPEDRLGYRRTGHDVPALNVEAQRSYAEMLRKLLKARPESEEGGEWTPNDIGLSTEAAKLRNTFEAEIEHALRAGADLDGMQDWGAKLVGNVVRLAGLIHLAHQVQGTLISFWPFPVTGRAMETAIGLGRALIPHARFVFDQMDMLPELHLARYVLERILAYEGETPLTKRELHRRCQGNAEIQKVSDLDRPLRLLKQHNYLRVTTQASTGGRLPSPVIELNPKARKHVDTSDRSLDTCADGDPRPAR